MKKTPSNFKDLTGLKFGRLKVLFRKGSNKHSKAVWHCSCACGGTANVTSGALNNGRTKSCGCLSREKIIERNKNTAIHNMSGTPLWAVWQSMRQRCTKKDAQAYHNYGARGISVCAEWIDNFLPFYKWAMANGYKKGLDIDRKNNEGNYTPKNCRFTTRYINNTNTRLSRRWYLDKKVFRTAKEAANHFGVCTSTILNWCHGDKKYKTPPRPNCSAPKLYGDTC